MRKLYIHLVQHVGNQMFSGIVKAHSFGVNINYLNDEPITIRITNVINNHQGLLNKVVDITLSSENPVEGNLTGYVTAEADIIQFTR